MVREVVELVRKKVGSVASMRDAVVVPALPKTRSGTPIIVIVGLFYRISRSLLQYILHYSRSLLPYFGYAYYSDRRPLFPCQ